MILMGCCAVLVDEVVGLVDGLENGGLGGLG